MYAPIGNKHFFTKSCHPQTYQNYEQSQQKLGTFLENKVFHKSKFSQISFLKVDLLVKYSAQKKIERFGWFLMPKNDFESTNFANIEEVVLNFGRCDDDMI